MRLIHVSSLQNLASVLVSDALDDVAIDLLKARGIDVANLPGLSPEDLLKEIGKHDALIVRSGTQVCVRGGCGGGVARHSPAARECGCRARHSRA